MIFAVMFWVLIKLGAPAWCMWLNGIALFFAIVNTGINIGKAVGKSK